jgi:adenine-specific DNA-methyltransferase
MNNEQTDKLDLRSHDIAEDKKQELLRLFPEMLTEGGKIDLERLKLALGETVDVGKERYGMNWPGKADCFKAIQSPSLGTLRPCPEESVNFDTTENLIIDGDNLEVLKLLQKSYLGKVKMIYIDPPYNTGNDFIYPDNYTESLQTYLEYTGQVDAQGKKFSTNTEADGRFHSKWLNMMYPRLYLARNLLREDGVIFISIDDHEVDNLRKICNEVFGEENFKGAIIRGTGQTTGQDSGGLGASFDYVLVYSRESDTELAGIPLSDEDMERFEEEDERGRYAYWQLRKTGSHDRRQDRPKMFFPVNDPEGNQVYPMGPGGYESCWRFGPATYEKMVKENYIIWKKRKQNGQEQWWPYVKYYLEGRTKRPSPLWADIEGSKKASIDLKNLFGIKVFNNPKPLELIIRLLQITPDFKEGDMVLDFFSGSATTAHALLELCNRDRIARKFMCIQLPEATEPGTEAHKAGYLTIAEIAKERVRRVIKKLTAEDKGKLALNGKKKLDLGFRVFKLAESNFKAWNANLPTGDTAALKQQLELHIDHIRDGRAAEDILFEILVKSGFPLTTPVEKLTMEGKNVFSAAGGALFICLERNLTLELIRAMAERKPERVVCLDNGFSGNDQLKANAVQIFKSKGVTSFKTV